MVFERFRTALLEKQLKRAQDVTRKQQATAKKKIAVINKNQRAREALLKERLKLRKQQDDLKNRIIKAKQFDLTPSEKQTLETQLKKKKIRDEKLKRSAKKVGDTIFKGLKSTANFIELVDKSLSEASRGRRKPSKPKKRSGKRKKRTRTTSKRKKSSRNRSKSVKRKSKR